MIDGTIHLGETDVAPACEHLEIVDPEIFAAIKAEAARQHEGLELIASENFVSGAVLEAMGSVLTNKYAEGYPGKRYYGGCEHVDVVEDLARERAKVLFGADHANVQPHSGAQANMAAYFAFLQPGDKLLGMDLSHGGHLTHGSDMDALASLARRERPAMIVAGASAYPRILPFEEIAAIAREVGAMLLVDMAHIAGLVAAGVHPSPVPWADIVTTTTHKTLRGPRGGLILCKEQHAKAIDKSVFPGMQGGPLEHVIAAKAVALFEAQSPAFVRYSARVVENAHALADGLMERGWKLVSDGTDTHLLLVDLRDTDLSGKDAEEYLGRADITVNKNTVPGETRSPFVTSGIRIGTPALTPRGMRESEMNDIAGLIDRVLRSGGDVTELAAIRGEVQERALQFPLVADAEVGAVGSA